MEKQSASSVPPRLAARIGKIRLGVLAGLLTLAASCTPPQTQARPPASLAAYDQTPILRLNSKSHTGNIDRAGYARLKDGRMLVVTGSRDNTIRFWDPQALWNDPNAAPLRILRPPLPDGFVKDESTVGIVAIDVSPDGSLVAVSRQLGIDKDGRGINEIAVYETVTGKLVARPFQGDAQISDLAFSPGGTRLAAGAQSANPELTGLWVWSISDRTFKEIRHDKEYGQSPDNGAMTVPYIRSVAFGSENLLMTTSFDGYVRRYENVGESAKPTLYPPIGAIDPFEIEFSPNGEQVAVSYIYPSVQDVNVKAAIEIRSAADYRLIKNLEVGTGQDVPPLNAATVRGISWSADGRYIYGNIAALNYSAIRRWETAGDGPWKNTLMCTDQNALEIVPFGQSGAMAINSDPCFILIDDNGASKYAAMGEAPRFDLHRLPVVRGADGVDTAATDETAYEAMKDFMVSPDGNSIYWHAADNVDRSFDLLDRRLRSGAEGTAAAVKATDGFSARNGGLALTNWVDSRTPALNGQPLDIAWSGRSSQANYWSWSADVAPSGKIAALGLGTGVTAYSFADGLPVRLWASPAQSNALRTNVPNRNENVVVVLGQDGVIKWYNALPDRGEVLLNLLVTKTGEWIVWTPAGYYDSSLRGEDLIGWQINSGPDDAAYFWPASRYRDRFYRPDVIDAVVAGFSDSGSLQSRDIGSDAMRLAVSGQAPPDLLTQARPIVSVLDGRISTEGNSRFLHARVRIESPSGKPVTAYRVLVSGRTEANKAGQRLPPDSEIDLPQVRLLPSDEVAYVVAETADGIGQPAAIRLSLDSRTILTSTETIDPSAPKTNIYALIVGVSKYKAAQTNPKSTLSDLNFTDDDARAIKRILEKQANHGPFGRVKVTMLIDNETDETGKSRAATKENITAAIQSLKSIGDSSDEPTKDDLVVIYFAGHGASNKKGEFYYLPFGPDYALDDTRTTPDGSHPIRFSEIATKALSGSELELLVRGTDARVAIFLDTCRSADLIRSIASFQHAMQNAEPKGVMFSAANEKAYEYSLWGNGAFTKALIDMVEDGNLLMPIYMTDRVIDDNELAQQLKVKVDELVIGSGLLKQGDPRQEVMKTSIGIDDGSDKARVKLFWIGDRQ